MNQPPAVETIWASIAAALTACVGALVKLVRVSSDVKRLGERSHVHAREITGHESRLARLEEYKANTGDRLTRIEETQDRIETKLDAAIARGL